jgi:hypothetical protein
MSLLILLAAFALIYRLWSRLNRMDSVLTDLTARLHRLEEGPAKTAPNGSVSAHPSTGASSDAATRAGIVE